MTCLHDSQGFIFLGMSGFAAQSAIVYGVNLFTMPGMQHAVYAIKYKVIKSPCYKPVAVYCLLPWLE